MIIFCSVKSGDSFNELSEGVPRFATLFTLFKRFLTVLNNFSVALFFWNYNIIDLGPVHLNTRYHK